jgi:hypothetical protein
VDPKKVAAILDWKAPKDVRGIKSFIGMAGYYQRFIEGFSNIARPITTLLAKKVEFKWTPACQESFETLKKLTTTPVPQLHPGERLASRSHAGRPYRPVCRMMNGFRTLLHGSL